MEGIYIYIYIRDYILEKREKREKRAKSHPITQKESLSKNNTKHSSASAVPTDFLFTQVMLRSEVITLIPAIPPSLSETFYIRRC